MVSLSTQPLDIASVLREISTPESGGIDIFVGTVRNHSRGKRIVRLEYSAYIPMAEKMMAEIEAEIRRQWPVHRVVLAHRIGTLQIGDIAVVTAVSSAHRHVAFAACRHAIERVKAVVPIWKKEFSEDGEAWVEGVHTEGVTGERRKADVEENAHG